MDTKYLSLSWPVCVLAALVTLMVSACSPGHSGETEAQLEKRYGKPVRIEAVERSKDIFYRWTGYEIAVSLFDGISDSEVIRKEQGGSFSADEMKRWLEQQGVGQEWIEDRGDAKGGWEKTWHRADKKARAGYRENTLLFDTLWLHTLTNDDADGELLMPVTVLTQPTVSPVNGAQKQMAQLQDPSR